jgi:hypothetical protein
MVNRVNNGNPFKPYGKSEMFKRIYRPDTNYNGRLVNTLSVQLSLAGEGGHYPEPILPLVIGSREDLASGDGFIEKHNLLMDVAGKPFYFFNNHGWSSPAVTEAIMFERLLTNSVMLLFDAHADGERAYPYVIPDDPIAALREIIKHSYFDERCFVWDMVRLGCISKLIWFESRPYATLHGHVWRGDYRELRRAFPHLEVIVVREEEIAGFDKSQIDGLPQNRVLTNIDWDFFCLLKGRDKLSTMAMVLYACQKAGAIVSSWSRKYLDNKDKTYARAVNLIQKLDGTK